MVAVSERMRGGVKTSAGLWRKTVNLVETVQWIVTAPSRHRTETGMIGVLAVVFLAVTWGHLTAIIHVLTWVLIAASFALNIWAWRDLRAETLAGMSEKKAALQRWYYPRRLLAGLLAPPAALFLFAVSGWLWDWVLLLLTLAAIGGLFFIEAPEPEDDPLDNHELLVEALTTAGVLAPSREHNLGMPGDVGTDEHGGRWRTIKLPAPNTWEDVEKNRVGLAAVYDVPVERIVVEHAGGAPNNVKLRIDGAPSEPVATQIVTSSLATAGRTCWRDPVRIGYDRLTAEPVLLHTDAVNTLVGGIMGKGKTVLVRIPLLHYALDPTTTLYVSDGKGSRKDYNPIRPLCKRFVWGTDEDAPEQLLSLLTEVLEVVRTRNEADFEGSDWQGVLLVLEEFQDIRSSADRDVRDAIDNAVKRIIRMGRAVAVHVLFATQRPSVDDMPSGFRNLVSQRIALALQSSDSTIVLSHHWPKHLPTPSGKGEAIFWDTAQDVAVQIDYLDGPAWAAACQRAAVLRAEATPAVLTKAPTAAPQPVREPTLREAVHAVIGSGKLTTRQVYERLPEHLKPVDVPRLGREMSGWAEVGSSTTRGTTYRYLLHPATLKGGADEPAARSNGHDSGLLHPALVSP